MKKRQLLLSLLSIFLFASCSFKNNSSDKEQQITIGSDNNYDVDSINPISEYGQDNEYDSAKELDNKEESLPEQYETVSGYEIANEGDYYLSGDYPSINITAKKNSIVNVYLDGININNEEGIAFSSDNKIELHVVLLNESINTIENNFLDKNAFHIKGDVYISGSGTLNITSKQKNGIKVSKDLYVSGDVTLNVNGQNHAIAARSITTNGATINVTSKEKDGIQLECDSDVTEFDNSQGFAYLVDTNFTADVYGDGIQADTYVYISGGTYDITTHGEFVQYSSTNMETYDLSSDDFKYIQSGNSYKRVAKDEIRSLSSKYYALSNSVKGIKAGAIEYDSDGDDVDDTVVTNGKYDIYIAHMASININSYDDCIHTNYGTVNIDNSTLSLTTLDDGVHADYDLNIYDASISIASSYEGLEGANVKIDGQNTNIVSVSEDDGINAASDYSNTNNIYINDGYLRIYASGDGIDANSTIYLNGGTIIVEGPGRGNGSLDAELIQFNGGIVFSCSSDGMTERMSATQNTFVYQGNTMQEGTKVSVVNSDNNAIYSYTLKQSCNQLIFSSPDLIINESYKIVLDNTTYATIKMTSSLTKSTSGQFGPGGGRR